MASTRFSDPKFFMPRNILFPFKYPEAKGMAQIKIEVNNEITFGNGLTVFSRPLTKKIKLLKPKVPFNSDMELVEDRQISGMS